MQGYPVRNAQKQRESEGKGMKLKCQFEIVEAGDELVAVPVGKNATEINAMLKLNKEAADMLKCIETSSTPEEALDKVMELYPGEDKNEVGKLMCGLLNKLVQNRLLDPNEI